MAPGFSRRGKGVAQAAGGNPRSVSGYGFSHTAAASLGPCLQALHPATSALM